MFNNLKQAFALIFLIVTAIELENQTPGAGANKKAQAVTKIAEELDKLLPDWLNPVVKGLTPFLIDAIVTFANKSGFFGQFAASSNT